MEYFFFKEIVESLKLIKLNKIMQKVDLKRLEVLLSFFWNKKKSLYLWGRPSSGKTSIIRQYAQKKAKELKLEYSEDKYGSEIFTMKIITMSQFDAADLRGMPEVVKIDNDKVTRFLPTEELPRQGQGIIFFDEMNLADDLTRATMYQYILEGRISNLPPVKDEKGADKFWRIAASNSERDYSNVNTTSLALLSRFCHLEVEPELEEIIDYFLQHDNDPRIIGYLKNFPQDLFPQVFDERLLDQKANPFPRQWENASHLIKDIQFKNKGDRVLITELVSACVGQNVGVRFSAWLNTTSKLNIARFIEKPKEEIEKIKNDKEKASLFYAVVSSLASFWFKKEKKLTALKVVDISSNLPPEFSVAFLKMILKARVRAKELTVLVGFDDLLNKLGVFLEEDYGQEN